MSEREDAEPEDASQLQAVRRERDELAASLYQTEQRWRAVFEQTAIGMAHVDVGGNWLLVNGRLCEMLGYSRDELLHRTFHRITPPEDLADLSAWQDLLAGKLATYSREKRFIREDGTHIRVDLTVSAVRDVHGVPTSIVCMVEDITERRLAEEELRQSESRYRQMFERNQAIKLLIDPASGEIVDANTAASAFYGYSPDELRARNIVDINALSPEQVAAEMALARTEARSYFVFRHRLAGGEVRDVEVHSSPIDVGGRTLLYSIIHDISERKRVEADLVHQALHDALTGLPNRALLHDRLQQAVLLAQRDGQPVALFIMDLDRFKEINDTFGHQYGDALLRELGLRLQGALRRSDSVLRLGGDTMARLGGDEFAVILPETDARGAARVADKLLTVLGQPCIVEGQSLAVGGSIGIALFPEHGQDATVLMRRADVAMYQAKRTQAGYAVYNPAQDEYSPQRHARMAELRQAIEQGNLHLHYQPIIGCTIGDAGRVEALVRWQHPEHGAIAPDEFIELAEHAGLIKPLTIWVLREALAQCRRWRDAGLELGVAVNISAQSLPDLDLAAAIERALSVAGAAPSWLEVEITESAVMADAERSMRLLRQLQDSGIRISIDDFGTGYSSLAYLRRLPVDAVKIDRAFVQDMLGNEDDAAIVRSVIDLGHSLGLEVVAEGVEDKATWDLLVAMGCDLAQGYYLGYPMSAEDTTAWLTGDR